MGSVWAAENLNLKAEVAVKLVDPAIAHDPEILRRFHREAQAAAALESRHVVRIFDYGVDSGQPYIVMERLIGETLGARLERCGRITPEELIPTFVDVARAMKKAHAAGIVHRDLKPDNIFIVQEEDADELAKVLDFGVAKRALLPGIGLSAHSATHSGFVVGTAYYMSPEQAQGQKSLDHRSDLWALGVIAFECLVGFRPFADEALGRIIVQICSEPLPVPSRHAEVPPGFDAWFAQALERDPAKRFQSAKELVNALSEALGVQIERTSRPAPRSSMPPARVSTPELVAVAVAASGARKINDQRAPDSWTPALVVGFVLAAVGGLFIARGNMASSPAKLDKVVSMPVEVGLSAAPPASFAPELATPKVVPATEVTALAPTALPLLSSDAFSVPPPPPASSRTRANAPKLDAVTSPSSSSSIGSSAPVPQPSTIPDAKGGRAVDLENPYAR
jgi:serine/threonine-protein kinase